MLSDRWVQKSGLPGRAARAWYEAASTRSVIRKRREKMDDHAAIDLMAAPPSS
jgi:hypothetical protein